MQQSLDSYSVVAAVSFEHSQAEAKRETATVVASPDGVSQDVWLEFVAHRKRKKARVSKLVVAGIQREADKAGWPLEAALAETVVRGWQSFKAEWVADKSSETAYQKSMREKYEIVAPMVAARNPSKRKLDPNTFFDKPLEIGNE